MKKAERIKIQRIAESRRKLAAQPERRSIRYRVGRVLGLILLPVIIFILGMLPFFSYVFAFFLLLVFFIKPSEEVREAPLQAALWTIIVLPLLLTGFAAPFRSLTIISAKLLEAFPIPWPDELRQLLAPMPLDTATGVLGATLAMICGSFALATLRTQQQQLANIATSTSRSAAIGLAEFKGRARMAKGPDHRMRLETFHPGEPGIPEGIPKERILHVEERWTGNAIGHRKMWRTFYLEDGTGRILVDPRAAEFWQGDGSPYFEPLRKIHLSERVEQRFLNPLPEETRWLEDGDPVYIIGSVEVNLDAPAEAMDAERLVVRPSTELRRPGALERFILPSFIGKKLVPGRQYYHLFYLSDRSEHDLAEITKMAEQRLLLWTLAWLGLSLWLAVRPFRQ